jgi:hypothetical protein
MLAFMLGIIEMSKTNRVIALIITLLIVAAVIVFALIRIGQVIGWSDAGEDWPIVLILFVFIIVVGGSIFIGVRNRLNR